MRLLLFLVDAIRCAVLACPFLLEKYLSIGCGGLYSNKVFVKLPLFEYICTLYYPCSRVSIR